MLTLLVLPGAVSRAATSPDPAGTGDAQRPLTPVFDDVVIGDFQLIGNALLKCDTPCTTNNTFDMVFLDADSNASTSQSSSASFTVPAGATVKFAFLSWTGYTNKKFPLPEGADLLPVKMSVDNDQNYQEVYADPTRHARITQGAAQWLTAGADVTSTLKGMSGTHEVWVADPPTFPGWVNQGMGWGLTVVYEWATPDPSAGRVARQVTVLEGFVTEQGGLPPTDVKLNIAPIIDTNLVTMGLMAVEGDFDTAGDTLELGASEAELVNVPEPQTGNLDNFFVSWATGATNPSSAYNQNVDAKTLDVPGILPAGTTTPFIRLKTGYDGYAINIVTFSAAVASLNLTKTADVDSYDSTEDSINYSFTVNNPTAVTITNVAVTDKLEGLGPITCDKGANGEFTLASGESTNCSATYTIQPGDVGTQKEVVNSAIATGIDTAGRPVESNEPTVTVPCVNCSPAVSLTKTVDPKVDYAGEQVTYTFTAKNTGNTVLSNVTIADPLPGLGALTCTIDGKSTTNGAATLVPSQSMICTAPYTLTEADEAAGQVTNTATVTGTPPPGQPDVTDDAKAIVGVQIDEFTIEKLVTVTDDCSDAVKSVQLTKAGDVIYCYTVTNTGKTTLTGVKAVDDLATPDDPSDDQEIKLGTTTLKPGESTTGTLVVPISQDQVDAAANLTNTVGVTTDREPDPVTDTAHVIVAQQPGFSITKTVSPNGSCVNAPKSIELAAPGEVTYCYTLINTGNVTLTDIVAIDDMATPDDTSDDVLLVWDVDAIGPGGSAWTSLKVTIAQAHLDDGTPLVNTVTVTTKQVPDPATDTAEVTFAPQPKFTISKKVSATGNCADAVEQIDVTKAQTVTYCYTLTNTGNTTLSGITAVDDMATPDDTSDDVTVTLTPDPLEPGQTATGTLQVAITADQLGGPALVNTISVVTDQKKDPVTDTAVVVPKPVVGTKLPPTGE